MSERPPSQEEREAMERTYGTRYGTGLLKIRLDQMGEAIGVLASKDIEMLPAPGSQRAGEGEPWTPEDREAEAEGNYEDGYAAGRADALVQRAGEGEAGEGEAELQIDPNASKSLDARAGEPPTPDDVERAAKAMQAIGHDRWRGSVWEAGMGWRTLAWDEVRDDEKRFVRELARAALESRDGS